MQTKPLFPWIAVALILGPLAVAVYGQGAAPPPTADPIRVITLKQGGDEGLYALAAEKAPQGDYWIGIALGELPAVAKKQLKLEHGLVVEDVLPDSPAKKAGLQQHDVLIQASDKELQQPADILQAVEAAKETPLSIEVVRDGQRLSLKVTPAKRPQPQSAGSRPVDQAADQLREKSIKKIEEALEELKGKTGGETLGLFFARAGVVATNVKDVELPKNMRIMVTKEEEGPAKIQVWGDDKEWNVTADKINELPAEVRRHVEQLLGKVMHPLLSERAKNLNLVGDPRRHGVRSPGVSGMASSTYRATVTAPQPPQATQSYQPQFSESGLHAYRVKERDDGIEEKLSLIIRKLDTIESKAIEQLQEEVKRLRKELDELRSK